jgi:hypothetical protein
MSQALLIDSDILIDHLVNWGQPLISSFPVFPRFPAVKNN